MTRDEIIKAIRARGIGYTVEGYELAFDLLTKAEPNTSSIQRKVLAAQLSNSAHFNR